jgi:Copper transport outer membrane protein, MctB
MNNFRYHVVSLTAVFLALAIGLIVGTAGLNGAAADALKNQVSSISNKNGQYRDQIKQLSSAVQNSEQFADEVAPALLQDKLAGRKVLVVSMPESSAYVPDVLSSLALAGAKVTTQVQIQDNFTLPSKNVDLLDLATTALNTTTITGLPSNSDGVETSSALLAAVLMQRTTPVPDLARKSILKAYENQNFITVTGDVGDPAEAVIFVARQPYTDPAASQENAYMVTMVSQFQKAGPIVVGAAQAAGGGNVISAITGDAALRQVISTVDNINLPEGQIATVLALNEQVTYNRTGHYGLASGATSLVPKLPE